ncbi:hypothetical protein [Brumimicrobium oceani]|uniref:Uncharacterized protein n=1 Tax=Brumimicrobium oceani TaxID=2100725 RepID=A0A2U2XA49_9FLAO|nr:hypothetical protein [Brumimicrobium oceani]PWH84675.1 hypothetical protein DIT68_13195 [Brumimicrobium oceani]
MARKATEINKKNLEKLKESVLKKIDFKLLRSVDCDKLAKVTSKETESYINGITFKRIYGFTKYNFNPSVQTLDIISQFVGFNNWYEFEMSLNKHQPISDRELDILLSFYDFDLINNIEFHDGGIQSMSRKIALRFREDVSAFKRAIPFLAKNKYAQKFFIEHFPDYDNLCNYYYLLYEEYLKQSERRSAQLLCHSMLFLKSFWTLNEEDCVFHISEIRKIGISKGDHTFLIGRYYAYNILYETKYGKKEMAYSYYDEYLALRDHLPKSGKGYLDFPASEYIISEALLYLEAYPKCIEIIELAYEEFSLKMEFVRKGYYRQMHLFWLIAKKHVNPSFKIEKQLQKINPNIFYFISMKYFSVTYNYAKFLSSGDFNYLEQSKETFEEMGVTFFTDLLIPQSLKIQAIDFP